MFKWEQSANDLSKGCPHHDPDSKEELGEGAGGSLQKNQSPAQTTPSRLSKLKDLCAKAGADRKGGSGKAKAKPAAKGKAKAKAKCKAAGQKQKKPEDTQPEDVLDSDENINGEGDDEEQDELQEEDEEEGEEGEEDEEDDQTEGAEQAKEKTGKGKSGKKVMKKPGASKAPTRV